MGVNLGQDFILIRVLKRLGFFHVHQAKTQSFFGYAFIDRLNFLYLRAKTKHI